LKIKLGQSTIPEKKPEEKKEEVPKEIPQQKPVQNLEEPKKEIQSPKNQSNSNGDEEEEGEKSPEEVAVSDAAGDTSDDGEGGEPVDQIDIKTVCEILSTEGEGAAKDHLYSCGLLPSQTEDTIKKARDILRGNAGSEGSDFYHHTDTGALRQAVNADDVEDAMGILNPGGDTEKKPKEKKEKKPKKEKIVLDRFQSLIDAIIELPVPVQHAREICEQSGHNWDEILTDNRLEVTKFFVRKKGVDDGK